MTGLDESVSCERKIPEITQELDAPPVSCGLEPKPLPNLSVNELEKRRLKHEFLRDRWAYYLMIICIALLVAVYVFETVLEIKYDKNPSELAKMLFETLKFLTSSLIGFLFAKRVIQ